MATSKSQRTWRPFNRVKFMEIGLGCIVIAVIGLLLLGYYPLSHPRLTKKIMVMARQPGLDSCSFAKVTVAVWKGVSFHDVSLAGKTPDGDRFSVQSPVITLKCNVFMLAARYGKIRKIALAEFRDFKTAGRNDPVAALRAALRVIGASRYFKGATVSKALVIIKKKKMLPMEGRGVEMELVFPEGSESRFKGSFSAATVLYANNEVARQAGGNLSYDKGVIDISQCKVRAFDGRMKIETRLNAEKNTLSSLSFSVDDLDLGAWSRLSDTSNGRLAGKADFRFTLDSSALNADSLRGKGTIAVSRFEIHRFPFQKSLVTMLLYPGLTHLTFKKFKANLKLKQGEIVETDASGEGDTLSVKMDGWIRTDGLLNEKLECTLSKAGVGTLPEFAQKTLEDAPGGGRVLRCRVYGMIQNPKVSVESRVIIQKAVTNMFEEVKNNLQLWMR